MTEREEDDRGVRQAELAPHLRPRPPRRVDALVGPVRDDGDPACRPRQLIPDLLGRCRVVDDERVRRVREDHGRNAVGAPAAALVRIDLVDGPQDAVAEQPCDREAQREERELQPGRDCRASTLVTVVPLRPVEVQRSDVAARAQEPAGIETLRRLEGKPELAQMRIQEALIGVLRNRGRKRRDAPPRANRRYRL